MKIKIASLLSIVLVIFFSISCGSSTTESKTETTPAEKPQDNLSNKNALEEIRKEQKITEAFINDANVLYVSVADDGTKRDGYAQYLCGVLAEHKATTKVVKVMKAGSIGDANATNAYGVQLGEANCQ